MVSRPERKTLLKAKNLSKYDDNREKAIKLGQDPDAAYYLTKQQVEHALKISFSSIAEAARVYKYPDGREIPRQTFREWIDCYGIDPYSPVFQKNCAEMAYDVLMRVTRAGKEKSLHKVLDTIGHHVHFEPKAKKYDIKTSADVDLLSQIDPSFDVKRIVYQEEKEDD